MGVDGDVKKGSLMGRMRGGCKKGSQTFLRNLKILCGSQNIGEQIGGSWRSAHSELH
jgi:hypothetical protein